MSCERIVLGVIWMYQVFIDGSAGTTGLKLAQRLQSRSEIQILRLPEEQRKVLEARVAMIEQADIRCV